MRSINMIVVHCSATRADCALTTEDLETIHRRRGFRGIGYHYYIRRDGTVVNTRALELVGAHAKGHNAHSIGICYEGGLDEQGRPADTRTELQKRSLRVLVRVLAMDFQTRRIVGHRDLSPDLDGDGVIEPEEWTKVCPCFDVGTEL